LKFLITPDDEDIQLKIENKVRMICIDEIKKIDRKDFNLEFDNKVYPKLESSIINHLSKRYGIKCKQIFIHPLQTEDGERFNAILKRAVNTHLEIEPIANSGQGDAVKIELSFEVVAMAENGWEDFESKDFGFKLRSPKWTAIEKNKIKKLSNAEIGTKEFELVRKEQAIEKELYEITERIRKTIEEKFSKIEDFDNHSRDIKVDERIRSSANKLVKKAIEDEFGLIIELRQFKRLLTESEELAKDLGFSNRETKKDVLANRSKLLETRHKGDIERLKLLMKQRDELTEDGDLIAENFGGDTEEKIKKIDDEIEKLTGIRESDPYKLNQATDLVLPNAKHSSQKTLEDKIKHLQLDK